MDAVYIRRRGGLARGAFLGCDENLSLEKALLPFMTYDFIFRAAAAYLYLYSSTSTHRVL